MITAPHIRSVLRAEPFRPFTLHLGGGRQVRVEHPENVAFVGKGGTIVVSYPKTDSFEIVSLLLISSIEVDRAAPRRRFA